VSGTPLDEAETVPTWTIPVVPRTDPNAPVSRLGSAEALDLGNEDGVMGSERTPGKPTTRRYSPAENLFTTLPVTDFAATTKPSS
jgi:hypothetical protein